METENQKPINMLHNKNLMKLNLHSKKIQLLASATSFALTSFQTSALASLEIIRSWKGSPVLLQSVEFSPDGKKLLTASGGGIAQLWSLNGAPGPIMEGQRPTMFYAHFNNQGSRILTTGYDGSAWLWNNKGKLLHKFSLHNAAVADARFVGNHGSFVSSSDDGQVVVRNSQGMATWTGIYPGTARQLAVTPKGNLVVSSSDNGVLHIIHNNTAEAKARTTSIQTPHGRINQISIDLEITKIAAAGKDGTVSIWDFQGTMLNRLKATTKGWANGGVFCKTKQSPLLTIGDDGVAVEWSNTGKRIGELKLSSTSRLTKVDCAPNGRMAAVVGSSGELWLLSITP